jgi:hypothetical protein
MDGDTQLKSVAIGFNNLDINQPLGQCFPKLRFLAEGICF